MKKSIIVCLLLLLCLNMFAAAQEEITITPSSNTQDPQTIVDDQEQQNQETPSKPTFLSSEDKQDPKTIVKDATGAAKDSVDQGIKIYDESVELTLPTFLEKPTQFLFHTNGEQISLNLFLILVILFCMLFMILHDIAKEMFESKLIHNGVAFILTVIASLIGVLYNFTSVITNLTTAVTASQSVLLETVIVFVILILLFLLLKYGIHFLHGIRQESKTEEASRRGMALGNLLGAARRRTQNAQKN